LFGGHTRRPTRSLRDSKSFMFCEANNGGIFLGRFSDRHDLQLVSMEYTTYQDNRERLDDLRFYNSTLAD
jgi:hypothetical protein